MNDDIVGRPIYSVQEFIDPAHPNLFVGLIETLGLHVSPNVLIAVLLRADALVRSAEEHDFDGFMLATVGPNNALTMYISTKDGEEFLEASVPEGLDDLDRPKWIIGAIQGIANQKNLLTDPELCQCFCGYGGHPDDWPAILLANII